MLTPPSTIDEMISQLELRLPQHKVRKIEKDNLFFKERFGWSALEAKKSKLGTMIEALENLKHPDKEIDLKKLEKHEYLYHFTLHHFIGDVRKHGLLKERSNDCVFLSTWEGGITIWAGWAQEKHWQLGELPKEAKKVIVLRVPKRALNPESLYIDTWGTRDSQMYLRTRPWVPAEDCIALCYKQDIPRSQIEYTFLRSEEVWIEGTFYGWNLQLEGGWRRL